MATNVTPGVTPAQTAINPILYQQRVQATLIAFAERQLDEQDARQQKTKITNKIKELKTLQKQQVQSEQEDNGTQVFADMADSAYQSEQVAIASDGYATGGQSISTALLSSPLGSFGRINQLV